MDNVGAIPTVDLAGHRVSRLICGGNPISGFSHVSADLDREMVEYYTMENMLALLDECYRQGVNTLQSRGDRHQMRMYLEHRLKGGRMMWIAQTASELADIPANVAKIARCGPIAVYHHGTHTDNTWHDGKIDDLRAIINAIHDEGLPAGIGTHIPEVIEYIEDKGWETDFYMCSFYNLARRHKKAVATDPDAYACERFLDEDPPRMAAMMRRTPKPCIAFKILAATRRCSSGESVRNAFQFAYDNIKPADIVNVGMFQKYRNQARQNADIVRSILCG